MDKNKIHEMIMKQQVRLAEKLSEDITNINFDYIKDGMDIGQIVNVLMTSAIVMAKYGVQKGELDDLDAIKKLMHEQIEDIMSIPHSFNKKS